MTTIDLLADEYMRLHAIFEDFDDRALLIKGWSITVVLAGLIKAMELKNRPIAWLSASVACLFWLVEAMWKSFQQSFVPRILEIERAFVSDDPVGSVGSPLQIYSRWDENWWHHLPVHIVQPHIFLPHAVFAFIACYVAWKLTSEQGVGK